MGNFTDNSEKILLHLAANVAVDCIALLRQAQAKDGNSGD